MASMARANASDALVHAASEMIQFHGGIGFTWEHGAHLCFRRAKTTEQFLAARRCIAKSGQACFLTQAEESSRPPGLAPRWARRRRLHPGIWAG